MLSAPRSWSSMRAWVEWLRWPLLWVAVVPPAFLAERVAALALWPTRIGR